MKLTDNQEQEIRNALIRATKDLGRAKMTRWEALEFVAGYTEFKISLEEAMQIVNFIRACDLIKA